MIYGKIMWRNMNKFAAIRMFVLTTVFAGGLTAFAGTSGTFAIPAA